MSQIKAEYIDHMGDDLRVANAARVSFDKESDWLYGKKVIGFSNGKTSGGRLERDLTEKDQKLIQYLARNNHWTPFAHCVATFRITAPIFLARQLFKHKIGFVENEVSRRYVDSEPEFYVPDVWRKRAEDKKQGSSDESVELRINLKFTENEFKRDPLIPDLVSNYQKFAKDLYTDLLEHGVCPEQARMILPQSMMTSWYWTGSLEAWSRLYKLRSSKDAQKENHILTSQINSKMLELFPHSWEALTTKSE